MLVKPGQHIANAFVVESLPPKDFTHLENVEIENNASPKEKTKLKEMLEKYSDVFSKGKTDIGYTDVIQHRIKLTSDKIVKLPYRRMPPGLYAEVRDHLQDLLDANIIEPSCSPYASPVVVVRKKTGEIRLCCDYRRLNEITKKDGFPLPRIDEVVDSLKGCKYFSLIDMASGYSQVPVAEEDRHLTAFVVPHGLFQYKTMPFGLCNSPATYSRLMSKVFSGDLFFGVLIYLDDLLIYSQTFEEHMEKLEMIFNKLRKFGLKLKPSKCSFLKKSLVYLGHEVSEEGVRVDPKKIDVIKTWPVPKTIKDVRKFLGFAGFYRRFIKNFSIIASPLHDLTKGTIKQGKINWSDACQNAFHDLKDKLCSTVTLHYVDFEKPFYIEIDASSTGIGVILSQEIMELENQSHLQAENSGKMRCPKLTTAQKD